ncbi:MULTISPECIES: hypothetical protein [unclassified Mesorhizobium]|uniref:hypothetical protein n=1 Tax=unclassified Mesorhizobium TaxID=325217 RepID=UPI00112E30B3|nr:MULTISPECIES: hypothetical protein [unclassified Mesorhizobium]TPN57263.1 hypothetical protein FJ978_01180 [Mesorhizobium sp. B1-1-7]TPN57792.1 hypothetical protein FJ976_04035 [Mesorhizobium sp. B1-1-9]
MDATGSTTSAAKAPVALMAAAKKNIPENSRMNANCTPPRIYRDRVVGGYGVKDASPPYQWRIGRSLA